MPLTNANKSSGRDGPALADAIGIKMLPILPATQMQRFT
jgi:hypothetical protein